MENQKKYDVIALGELLIDFTPAGTSAQGNPVLEQNPGGAPCNVLSMLARYGRSTGFIGKIGNDIHGRFLCRAVREAGIGCGGLVMSDEVHTTLAFVSMDESGDRSFSFYRNPGADMALTEDEVNLDMIRCSRIFHFGTLSKMCIRDRSSVWQPLKRIFRRSSLTESIIWNSMGLRRKS